MSQVKAFSVERAKPADGAAAGAPGPADWGMAALDALPKLIAILDGQGVILWVNRAWREFGGEHGLTPPGFGVGQSYASAARTVDEDGVAASRFVAIGMAQVLRGERDEFVHEYPCTCDELPRWYLLRVRRVEGAPPAALLVSHEDVTDQRDAREKLLRAREDLESRVAERTAELAERERLHQQIVESLPGGVAHIASNGAFITANSEALRFSGLTLDELTRRSLPHFEVETIREDGSGCPMSEYPAALCIQTGKPQGPVTIGLRRKDGSVGWAVFTAVPVPCPIDPTRTGAVLTFLNITERKHAEDALRDSEERYRLMFEHNPQPMWVYDVQTLRFLAVNEAAVRHYGYTRSQFLGMSMRDVHPPEDFKAMEALVSSGAADLLECTWRQIKRDGSIIEVQMTSHGLQFEGRRANLVLAQDVTVRRRAEEALRRAHEELERRVRERTAELARINQMLGESEERFRLIAEHIREVVWIVDAQTRKMLYINPAYESVWGSTCERLYEDGRSFLDAVLPEDRTIALEGVAHQRLEPYDLVYRIRDAAGQIKWIRTRSTPIHDAKGNVYRITGIAEDITDLKRAEAELLRLASIVESSDDAILGKSLDGKITSWNSGAQQIYGYTAAEVVGRDVGFLMQPAEREKLGAALDRLSCGERIESFETVRVRKDGTPFHVSMTLSSVKDSEGHVIGASAIERDITARRRLEQEVLRIGERERRRIGQDLHDGLGQHLTGIAFLGKSLQHRLETKAAAESPVNYHEAREAEQIADLVQQAIGQTRALARGLHPVEQSAGGLTAALQDLAQRVEAVFRINCRLNCQKPLMVPDDETATHLYRIAQEAVNNAVKYAQCESIEIAIECSESEIRLSITDDGIGIPEAGVSSATPGLGLRIMRYRAKMINGSLNISRGPNGGTVVTCVVDCACSATPACAEETNV
jgi:PAS domain S-box-containing protein